MIVRHKSTMKPDPSRPSSVVYESDKPGRITPRVIQFLRDHNASERLIKTALDGLEAEKVARAHSKKPNTAVKPE